jgi:prepilin-type N-terminal cleavage/methylation domain-containing protein
MHVLAGRRAFTLIEVLVVIAIIGLLVSILLPSLSRSRISAKSAVCLARLRNLGQGLVLYANANQDALPPGRMPAVNDDQTRNRILGGIKFRPTFLAMMGNEVGMPPFEDPQANRKGIDRFGQPGDRQNYAVDAYVCPEMPEWLDERNGSYGYNYQFLGNARLQNPSVLTSYKNWSVRLSRVKAPAACVAVADSMGTAATFGVQRRQPYQENLPNDSRSGRDENAYGNEGFNLDPPRIDEARGEAAGFDVGLVLRTAVHPRHADKADILWVDNHASSETISSLGYQLDEAGAVKLDGDNRFFHINHVNEPWLEP